MGYLDNLIKEMLGPKLPVMHKVIVKGREIPNFYAKDEGPNIVFSFSHNFSVVYEVPREAAIVFANGIANALAIGQGYTHAEADTKDSGFAPKVVELGLSEEKPEVIN